MKILTIVFVAATAVSAIALVAYNKQNAPTFAQTDTPKVVTLEHTSDPYAEVFPQDVALINQGAQSHIALTEANRQKYVEHFKLPDNAPWDVVQDEAIERVLEKAN